MMQLTRRNALKTLGFSALGLSLAKIGSSAFDSFTMDSDLKAWLSQLRGAARSLRESSISPLQWQEAMDAIYGSTPIEPLKERIRFDEARKRILEAMPSDQGELFYTIRLIDGEDPAKINGREPGHVLITKIAHVKKGESIPPHGHSSMVSAFLCLSGEFELRLYDRLAQRDDHLVVRKSVHEQAAGAGTWSSVSDYRDNVHWLKAKSDDCFLFTTKMLNVEKDIPLKGRINIDLVDARELGADTYRAAIIDGQRAKALY